MVQVTRCQFSEPRGQPGSRRIGHVGEGIRVCQLLNLLRDRVRHLLATETDVRAPHAPDGIEVFLAVGVGHITATTFLHDQRAFLIE